ncbi:MAG: tyrosine-type recombinase/integrase [Bacilli bacterium]|nr:tyrosine-type recombinase/integrase [Bacilli bacterium]
MNYIDKFLEYLKSVKKHSNNTIISYQDDLKELASVLNNNIIDINEEDIKKYLNYLYDKSYNKNTISRKLSGVRSFYNYLYNHDIIKINYFTDVHNPKKIRSLPHYLKTSEIDKVLDNTNEVTLYGERNKLIVELLYVTGLRVSELVNIKLKDIDKYNKSIKILGKGSKERIVYYEDNCSKLLNKYLNNTRRKLDKNNSEYLLLNKFGNKLSTRMIRNILNNLTIGTSIEQIYPHMIRHTFATTMLNNGADLMTVKELLGHESINTTSIYTHVTNEQIRKVFDSCHPRAKEK